MGNRSRHSRSLRQNRCADGHATFFITKCIHPRKWVLHKTDAARLVADALTFSVARDRIMLNAFCVMPDHWHALLYTKPPYTLPMFTHSLDSYIGGKTTESFADLDIEWQDGYQETRIRSSKQFFYVQRYIERNPTEKSLVVSESDWQWSSANSEYEGLLTRPWPWGFEQDRD